MTAITTQQVGQSALVQQAFGFWFADHVHIRSPFPEYIRADLAEAAIQRFGQWLGGLPEKAKEEVNEDMVQERLEEILFECALPLVATEDERFSILFPFLPRIGDPVEPEAGNPNPTGRVKSRSIQREGDHSFMKLTIAANDDHTWQTHIELPG